LTTAKAPKTPKAQAAEPAGTKTASGDRSFAEWLPLLPPHLSELVASLEGYVLSLGDDVQRKELKLYVAFKRLKNFATVVPQKNRLLVYLHLDPAQVAPLPANGRDVGQQGHWGTGDVELALASQADLDAAKQLIQMAYEGRGLVAASR
jgi:predicted transport protein